MYNRYILRVNKGNIWLISILIIPVISDSTYGLANALSVELPIGPGILLRGALLVIATLFILKHLYSISVGLAFVYFTLYFAMLPAFVIGLASGSSIITDITLMSKAVYLPTMVLLFYILLKHSRTSPDKILSNIEYSSYIFSVMLVLPGLLNIEVETYGDYAFGVKGFFQPGNDVGLALGIAILVAGYRLIFVKTTLFRLILMCLNLYAIAKLGSRASLFLLAGTGLTLVVATLLFRNKSNQQNIGSLISQMTTSLVLAIILISSLFYGFTSQNSYSYQRQKIDEITSGALPRQDLIEAAYEYIERRDVLINITGEGAERFRSGVATNMRGREYRISEVDWLDMYGHYGLLFAVTLHTFLFYVLIISARNIVYVLTPMSLVLASGLFLFIAHSIFAGHALFSPTPSTIAAAYMAIILYLNSHINRVMTKG